MCRVCAQVEHHNGMHNMTGTRVSDAAGYCRGGQGYGVPSTQGWVSCAWARDTQQCGGGARVARSVSFVGFSVVFCHAFSFPCVRLV